MINLLRKILNKPIAVETVDPVIETIENNLIRILGFMYDSAPVNTSIEGARIYLNVDSEELAYDIKKNEKLAESIEHLLRKSIKHSLDHRVFVDANGVRVQREKDLTEMVLDIAAQVANSKRPVVLNYKSSADRKIMHQTLMNHASVYTKSIGTGPNRKLMVIPEKEKKRRRKND